MEFLVGGQIKIAGTGEAEENRLFLPGLFAFQSLIDCRADGVTGFRSGKDALGPGEQFCGFKYRCLS